MAIAGKVAITLDTEPEWSSTKTYDRLVAVRYQGSLYISRKQSSGVEPTNTEYWLLAVSGTEVDTMTSETMGIGKPDNDTITVENGVFKAEINKQLLDKLGESEQGTLTFNGSEIKTNTDYVADTLADAQAAIDAGLVEDGATIYVKEDSDSISEMVGATESADGKGGIVPAPTAGQQNNVLYGNGTWKDPTSNPNLLINPDFKINQRGGISWTGKDQYTVDRWRQFIDINGTVKLTENGIVLDNTNGAVTLGQFFENYADFAGRTVTLSARVMQLSDTAPGGVLYIGGNASVLATVSIKGNVVKNKWVKIKTTYTMPEEVTQMNSCIYLDSVDIGKIAVDWVKLEIGSVATPFVPPDPATELLKCQRYYQKAGVGFCAYTRRATEFLFSGELRTKMRVVPTIILLQTRNMNVFSIIDGTYGTEYVAQTPYIDSAAVTASALTYIVVGGFAGLTAGCVAHYNSGNEPFAFDAEIY